MLINKTLAVLCIRPDAGHLIPLLKIATQAQNSGCDVHVIVPDELQNVVGFYGFNFCCHTFGKVEEKCDKSARSGYLQAGEISRMFKYNERMKKRYSEPLINGVEEKIGDLDRIFIQICPTLILADQYPWFSHIYITLSQ